MSEDRFEARLLGAVRLLVDGESLALPSHRALLALVVVLAAHPDRVERGWLAALLWPDRDDKTARTNLRVALHGGRRVLGDRLGTSRTEVWWQPGEADQVDLHRLRQALGGDGQVGRWAARPLLHGLDLGESGALEQWLEALQEDLGQAVVRHALERGRTLADTGRFVEAEEVARTAIAAQPRQVAAHQLLLEVLAATNQRASVERHRARLDQAFDGRPPAELTALARTVLGRVGSPRIGFVPAAVGRLIGRDEELQTVSELLAEHRLVTVIGLGGAGKTRLAQGVAAQFSARDGVWFVSLQAARPEDVPRAVAHALGVSPASGRPTRQALRDAVRDRDLLVVLDNAEVVEDAVAELAVDLLEHGPDVRVLVTSRRPLDLRAERVYALRGLRSQADAVALFRDRDPSAPEEPAVHELVDRMEGMPLALELTASLRRRLGSTQAVLEQLDSDAMRGTERDRPDRHRTLDAALQGTWTLLDPADQQALLRLATFRGMFDRDWLSDPLVHALERLVQAATVVPLRGSGLRVHELVRSFARRHDPEPEVRRQWHLGGTLGRLTEASVALYGEGHGRALDTLRALRSDLFGAWDDAVDAGEVEPLLQGAEAARAAADVLGWYEGLCDRLERARAQVDHPRFRVPQAWLLGRLGRAEEGLALVDPTGLDAEGVFTRTVLLCLLGRLEQAQVHVGALEASEDPRAWNLLGLIATRMGDGALARQRFEAGLAVVSEDQPGRRAPLLHGLASVARSGGEVARARELHVEALDLRTTFHDPRGLGLTLTSLATCEAQLGQPDRARRLFLQARRLAWDMGDPRVRSLAEHNLGCLELSVDDPIEALGRLDAAVALRRRSSDPVDLAASLAARAVAHARNTRAHEAHADIEEAITLAAELPDARLQTQVRAHEAEVLALLGSGAASAQGT